MIKTVHTNFEHIFIMQSTHRLGQKNLIRPLFNNYFAIMWSNCCVTTLISRSNVWLAARPLNWKDIKKNLLRKKIYKSGDTVWKSKEILKIRERKKYKTRFVCCFIIGWKSEVRGAYSAYIGQKGERTKVLFPFLYVCIYCPVGLITNPTLRVCPRGAQNVYFEIQTIQAVYIVSRFERVRTINTNVTRHVQVKWVSRSTTRLAFSFINSAISYC